jgi:hypothetical protein
MRAPVPELQGLLAGLREAAQVPDRTAAIKSARKGGDQQAAPVDLRAKSVADTPVEEAEQFGFSEFVRKLNTLRSGRSLKKHPELKQRLDDYFNNLDEGERTALVTFLDAIGKIIAADTHPASVPDPSDPPARVKMTRQKAEEIVREVIRRHLSRRAAG